MGWVVARELEHAILDRVHAANAPFSLLFSVTVPKPSPIVRGLGGL